MKIIIYFLPWILVASLDDLRISSEKDCMTDDRSMITNKYALLLNFALKDNDQQQTCSIHLANAWSLDQQKGLGIFLPRPIDCSTIITIECKSNSIFVNPTNASSVQYTCHTSASQFQMPCNAVEIKFQRNFNIPRTINFNQVQVISLAKEPCPDKEIFFQCHESYPNACVDRQIRCNGRSECPNGDDERDCHQSPTEGVPWIIIILGVLFFLFLMLILSIALICCCCRAAFHSILRRFRKQEKNVSIEKGEDAGLMKSLAAPVGVVEALPHQHLESNTVVIDSTKPVYPRLE